MVHTEKIAYMKGYRTLQDGTVIGLRGKPLVVGPDSKGRLYFRPAHNGGISTWLCID